MVFGICRKHVALEKAANEVTNVAPGANIERALLLMGELRSKRLAGDYLDAC